MSYSFENIAGYQREKEELIRLCEIFKERDRYIEMGAKLPKGIIFYGEPGTGKTLFAKVMADECGLNTLKIDLGSVKNESWICNKIRKTFKKASKSRVPTMIFFDEMDKVLPNPYEEYYTDRSKTILTLLLTLIDGMESSNNVVFVATCNNYNALPKTIKRPGRIDKKIGIGKPNFKSRVEILKMYIEQSKCLFDVSIQDMANICAGFSCAALETFVNECVLLSNEKGVVENDTLLKVCSEIKNENIAKGNSGNADRVRACRNVGAFLVANELSGELGDLSLQEYTVCNDYYNSLLSRFDSDYSSEADDDDDDDDDDDYDDDYDDDDENVSSSQIASSKDYINTITVLLGGYVAEQVCFGQIYQNAYNDFYIISKIFENLFDGGMLGIETYYSSELRFPCSNERMGLVAQVFDKVLLDCYAKAKKIIEKKKEKLNILIEELLSKKYLGEEAVKKLLD
ncbi:MAG: AAA family ATPase [Clostridia bacterium]|nr:AAA family ATPase [Clostridia bacterium]